MDAPGVTGCWMLKSRCLATVVAASQEREERRMIPSVKEIALRA
jgi:hypothetical protein